MNPAGDAVAEVGKALTKFTAEHAHEVGLPSPEAINFMFKLAGMLSCSALVGKDMGLSKDQIARLREFGVNGEELENRDQTAIIANGMGKMLIGRELGIEPMAAWLDIDIVKSKIFIRYPQLHRLIEEKGWEIEELERSHTRAAIKLTHATKKPRTFEFTIEDAKMAGLMKRGGYNNDSPSQYELRPRVMLWSRVISEAYRATGGKGSVYTPEEKQEIMREEVRDALAEPESRAPEPDPYAVAMPEPALLKPESAAKMPPKHHQDTTEIPKSEKTPEAHEVQVEGPDTSASAGAGSSASAQHAEDTGGASAAASSQAGKTGGELSDTPPSETKVREMPKPKIDPRVGPLMAEIEKLLPVKARKKIVEEYLRGYFGVGDIKSVLGDPRMLDALRLLQALAVSDQWKTTLAGDPHKLGVDAAAGCAKLRAYMEGWPEDCQETAFKIALARYPDDAGALAEYLADPIQAETLGFGDLRAFLWVLERVGPKHATMFRERAASMADLMNNGWEKIADMATLQVAIEELPEAEGQQNLLGFIRKGAAE